MLQPERKCIYNRTDDNNRLSLILEDLKYCPACAYDLRTVLHESTLTTLVCPYHDEVFRISFEHEGYVITLVNLGG